MSTEREKQRHRKYADIFNYVDIQGVLHLVVLLATGKTLSGLRVV